MTVKPFITRPVGKRKKPPSFCLNCSAVATTEALFQLDGAVVLQRYCDEHVAQANYMLAEE